MKYLFLGIFLVTSLWGQGQSENIFHNREFWKSGPTLEEVKEKIAAGNDPTALTRSNFDAAVYALIDKAPDEVIRYLLSIEGNGVSKSTHDGRSYLHWAAYAGNVAILKDLIDRDVDIHLVDEHGYSALVFAASTGQQNKEIYEILLENGANLEDTNWDGANALLLSVYHADEDLSLLKFFQKKGLDIASTDKNGNGLFNFAARKGNIPLMNKAIEMNLPYKGKNKVGENAVIFASKGYRSHTNGIEVYDYLEGLGLALNLVTKNGETPLHNMAYRVKDPAIFEYFLAKGVEINQANKEGNTMLMNAVNARNNDIALKLLPQVADINHKNKKGYSALTYALRRGQKEMFDQLIKSGADIQVLDKENQNLAAHLFITYRQSQEDYFKTMLAELQKYKVPMVFDETATNTLLHIAVDQQNTFLIEKALALGVDLNAKNKDGLAPIHLAVMKAKDPAIVNFLIDRGADLKVKTDFEETVYDLASENELLKETGFDLETLKK